MSSNLLDRMKRSLTFRLSVWHAAMFSLSTAVLFALLYVLLAAAMESNDREVIEARLRECAAVYESRGLSGLEELVERGRASPNTKAFFVRLAGRFGDMLVLSAPDDWVRFDGTAPANASGRAQPEWLRVPNDEERDFTVGTIRMSDGSSLQVGRSTNNREVLFASFRHTFFIVMTPALALGLAGGAWFAHRATKPVRDVVATARAIIDTGNIAERVLTDGSGSEFEDLARQFNRVLEKNQTLIRGMRDALDNVAHDLRTPLTRLRSTAELAVQSTADPVAREALSDCVEESDRVLTILTTLMDIAEAEAGAITLRVEKCSIANLLTHTVELYEMIAEEKRIGITTHFTTPCEAIVDPVRLRQVFANLLDNAIKYTPEGGNVRLACSSEDGRVVIRMHNTGAGIPAAELPRIWERLYRGDKSRSQRGLGLGLSLVKAFVEAHHGEVSAQSTPGAGAEFVITLPTAAHSPLADSDPDDGEA